VVQATDSDADRPGDRAASRQNSGTRAGATARRLAAALGCALGPALAACGVWTALGAAAPLPFSVALLVVGGLEALLAWLLLRRSRSAWAFMASLNGTVFVVTLFGAPKLRDVFELSLGLALLPALVFGTLTLLLALASEEIESTDRSAGTRP
jgi:hypothetical protein